MTDKLRLATEDGTNFSYDLWDDKSGSKDQPDGNIVPKDLEDYYLRQTKKKVPDLPKPKTAKKWCEIKPVEPPAPGASYNPALDDHVDLLSKATETEIAKINAERKILRATRLPPKKDRVTEEIKMKELMEGIDIIPKEESDEEEEEEIEDNDDDKKYRPAPAPICAENRKTAALRKREKRRKDEELRRTKEKKERFRQNTIYRLRSIKQEIHSREKELLERQEKRRRKREEKLKGTPKIGAVSFEEPDAEVQLRSELRGSLRLLKTEGSLLEDRYKSLQKRGIIEPRLKQKRSRRYKLKRYEKPSHRDMPEDYKPR